jgi:hypothetical protein
VLLLSYIHEQQLSPRGTLYTAATATVLSAVQQEQQHHCWLRFRVTTTILKQQKVTIANQRAYDVRTQPVVQRVDLSSCWHLRNGSKGTTGHIQPSRSFEDACWSSPYHPLTSASCEKFKQCLNFATQLRQKEMLLVGL